MTASDDELIRRVVTTADYAAYGELIRRYQSPVRQFLRGLTRGDAALADDLAQEAFVRAFRSLAGYPGDATFKTWLFGIAYNQWRNARRKSRDQTPLDSAEAEADLVTPSGAPGSDLRTDLAQAMAALSEDERAAVHLAFQQGLSHSEIAALTEWPLGTVKTHLARGKDKLRNLLSAWSTCA